MSDPSLGPWVPDLGDGTYRNPVLHADYSDPDVERVGDDYFLVSSSFASAPALPILHSRDLVNWRLVNHVVPALGWKGYDAPAHGRGVWAPSLRSHDGWLYVYFASPDEGVFMSRTRDPFGPWEPLVCVKRTIGWIDPCPFWDDDGRAYLVNGFANSRVGFKSILRMNRLSPDGTEVLSEGRFVFDGQDNHVTMEGPKVHKRGGWYYLFAPAGGVQYGWQTVLRSRSVWGPYEDRVVLHQGNTDVNGPHQGAWVETPEGESWFLHFQDKGAHGRVVHLQPLVWKFDWPFVGIDANNDGVGEPVATFRKPVQGQPLAVPATSDDFRGAGLGLQWQWQADPQPGWYDLDPARGVLRLHGQPGFGADVPGPNLLDVPHVLSQKFPAPAFRVEVELTLGTTPGVRAGLVVLGASFASLELRSSQEGHTLVLVTGATRWGGRGEAVHREQRVTELVPSGPKVLLVLEVRGDRCRLFGRAPSVAPAEFVAQPGLWVGAKFGLYCLGPGSADFGPVVVSALGDD